jgi:hypothetical protein
MTQLKVIRGTGLPSVSTPGTLILNDERLCDTLEPGMQRPQHPAIPAGTYQITLAKWGHVYSSMCEMLSKRAQTPEEVATAESFIDNGAPLLINVPGRASIMIHIGNTQADTEGCLMLGTKANNGTIVSSTAAYFKVYPILLKYLETDPDKTIEYVDAPTNN